MKIIAATALAVLTAFPALANCIPAPAAHAALSKGSAEMVGQVQKANPKDETQIVVFQVWANAEGHWWFVVTNGAVFCLLARGKHYDGQTVQQFMDGERPAQGTAA